MKCAGTHALSLLIALALSALAGCESSQPSVGSRVEGDGERAAQEPVDHDGGATATDAAAPELADDTPVDEEAPNADTPDNGEPDDNPRPDEEMPEPEDAANPDLSAGGEVGSGGNSGGNNSQGNGATTSSGGVGGDTSAQGGADIGPATPVGGASGASNSSGAGGTSGSGGGLAAGGMSFGGAASGGSSGSSAGGTPAGGAPVTPEPEAAVDGNPCPSDLPDNRDVCELASGSSCYYDQVRCLCQRTVSDETLWACAATDCPSTEPEGAENCEGVETRLCQYAESDSSLASQCACTGTDVWQCRTCPLEPPEAGTECDLPAGSCRYGSVSCSCENGVWEC